MANAQSAYDALMGRGQVAAAERLRDPFETYKAKQAQIGGDLRTKLAVNDVERKIAAEQHASGSGGFNGDWSKTFTYVIGGLQMAGAAAEINLGTSLLTTSAAMFSTGVGIPAALFTGALGLFLVCHGLDHANAGFQSIVTGVPQRTLTSQALDSLTGSEFYSDLIDGALGMAAGAAGAKILRLATMTDDMGRCMNMFSRAQYGGCFTGDTLVHVTAVADGDAAAAPAGHGSSSTATATATQCLAIAKVPIGSRVLAINPRPEEFDDSFSEPVQSEWARVSFLIVRNDLSVVEAEFIRPRAWIESLGLVKGARIDLAVPELEIDGLAEVTAVRPCPPIAEGEGRVVTGKFVSRDVANVVRITLASGTEIRATDVHPVWSIDREDWVPAGKLEPGEHVDTLTGPVAVARVEPLDRHSAVYNLEVHGEHVYRIAVDGVLVHNGDLTCAMAAARKLLGEAPAGMKDPHLHHILFKLGIGAKQQELVLDGQRILRSVGIDPIRGVENIVWAPWRVKGQHSIDALKKVVDKLRELEALGADFDDFVEALKRLGRDAAERGVKP